MGAGYTGLWTAYYLHTLQPGIRVALVEAEIAGFGASGRNGGWCLGGIAGIDEYLGDERARAGGLALMRAIFDTIDEVGRATREEGIDCHYAKGGMITTATTPFQHEQLTAYASEMRELGLETTSTGSIRARPTGTCA